MRPEPEAMVHDEDCMVAEIERLRRELDWWQAAGLRAEFERGTL